MFPKHEHVSLQVCIIDYYLFSDFRNYGYVLRAKMISSPPVSHLFQAMNVDNLFCFMVHFLPKINCGEKYINVLNICAYMFFCRWRNGA